MVADSEATERTHDEGLLSRKLDLDAACHFPDLSTSFFSSSYDDIFSVKWIGR